MTTDRKFQIILAILIATVAAWLAVEIVRAL